MKTKINNEWFQYFLEDEEGNKFHILDGMAVKIDDKTGKLYSILDKQSFNLGHQMGNARDTNFVFVYGDNELKIVKSKNKFDIEIIDWRYINE